LDHKNVAKQHILQIDIIKTTTQLAQNVKYQASVAIIGAISDLIKHFRRCLQNLAEASSTGDGTYRLNTELQSVLEMCILQLSKKVLELTLCITSLFSFQNLYYLALSIILGGTLDVILSKVSWILDICRSNLLSVLL